MRSVAFLVTLLIFASCNSSLGFREYHALQDGWPSNEHISFSSDQIAQTPSDIYIHIRNTNTYPYANLFLVAQLRDSIQVIARDTLEYAMADPQGKWLGTGFLEVKESKLWWKADWNPPHDGPYFIEFSQRVRNNGSLVGVSFLDGIINVGVSIVPQI